MFKSLLVFGLVLGSLLVLVPKPTAGYAVKLQGDGFGVFHHDDLSEKDKLPSTEDAFPDPNGRKGKTVKPQGDGFGEGRRREALSEKGKENVPSTEDAFPDPNGRKGKTVKPQGDGFGEGRRREALSEKGQENVPSKEDAFPDPNGGGEKITKENALSSEEKNLDDLAKGKSWTTHETDAYLTRYGYLPSPANGIVSGNERADAIKEFQRFSRLSETGIMDARTMKHMQSPRCGLPDPVKSSVLAEFNAKGIYKWRKTDLTYTIATYSRKLPNYKVSRAVAKAFKMWSDVSRMTFTEILYGKADLVVKFTPKIHGDKEPFDGKGGVLAHAFYPESGQIHLEEAEQWTIKSEEGTNLLYVLVHEIGHALGLGHSDIKNAIMEPVYIGYRPNLKLERDDIAGIQYLYGKPTVLPPRPAPPTRAPVTRAPITKRPVIPKPSPPTVKFPCPFTHTAMMTAGGRTYGFSRYIYEIHPDGTTTFLNIVSIAYPGGPRHVAAAAHNDASGKTFLFSDLRVWRFTNDKLDAGFPKWLTYFVRAAVVVDGELRLFSYTHIHIIDQDTMKDYVDGEVTIASEYPKLPTMMKAAVSYGDGLAYILYTYNVVQLDLYNGEMSPVESCYKR